MIGVQDPPLEGTDVTIWEEESDLEIDKDETHPRRLIPELCRLFYQLGWYFYTTDTYKKINVKDNMSLIFNENNCSGLLEQEEASALREGTVITIEVII